MGAINLSKGGFENRIAKIDDLSKEWHFLGDKPALIDFYASWCGPCQRLAPIIDEVAEELKGRVDIYKVNVDDEEVLAKLFKVRSIPTLVYIPMGELPIVQAGGKTKTELMDLIRTNLLK